MNSYKKFYLLIIFLIISFGIMIYDVSKEANTYISSLENKCIDGQIYIKIPKDTFWTKTFGECR